MVVRLPSLLSCCRRVALLSLLAASAARADEWSAYPAIDEQGSVFDDAEFTADLPSIGSRYAVNERVSVGVYTDAREQSAIVFSYAPFARFAAKANYGIAREEPLTFRVTVKGYELFESNTENGSSQFFSLDRYREANARKQYIALSLSKRF